MLGIFRRLLRPLTLSALVLALIWLGGIAVVWRDRVDTLRDSGLLAEALTRVVSERLNGSLRGVDLLLQDVGAKYREKGSDDSALVAVMRYRTAAFGEVRNVFVIGADGLVKVSTLPSMQGVDMRQRPYFELAAKALAHPGMVVAAPALSPITGRIGLVVARPIVGPLGTFEGVVAAALNPEFFVETLSGVVAGDVDRAVIANLDGDVLARLPDPGRHVGPRFVWAPCSPSICPRRVRESSSLPAPSTGGTARRPTSLWTIIPSSLRSASPPRRRCGAGP